MDLPSVYTDTAFTWTRIRVRACVRVCVRVCVQVDLPDFAGRVAILGVHSRGKPLETDVDMAQANKKLQI